MSVPGAMTGKRVCKLCGKSLRPQARLLVCHRKGKCAAFHRDRINEWRRALRALRGGLPKERLVGDIHHSWAGGRHVFCNDCEKFLGWRHPCQLRAYRDGTPRCRSCAARRKRKIDSA